MVNVLTYTQQDFDLLVALGMPDTQEPSNSHYNVDGETEAVIEFCVPIKIAEAYDKAFKPNRNEPGDTDGPLLDIGVDV